MIIPKRKTCGILNKSESDWLFAEFALELARNLWLEVLEEPADYNYVLSWDENKIESCQQMFVPYEAMKLASDKRFLADVFIKNKIPIPDTYLLANRQEVREHLQKYPQQEWCLKYPISCGGSGHRIIRKIEDIPNNWLKSYLVQRFIRQENPQVFRLYCAGGKLFGWNVREFVSGKAKQPWVAHARGAVYQVLEKIPNEVIEIATKTLETTNLFDSFGCVDLIQDENKNWLVLEVGTDGIFNYVDRNIGNKNLEKEIDRKLAEAFWSSFAEKPWGKDSWHPKL